MMMRKRRTWFIVGIIAIVAAIVFAITAILCRKASDPPRFILGTPPDVGKRFDSCSYDFAAVNPFAGGKVWIYARDKTSGRYTSLLFDLRKKQVIGEMWNAGPLCLSEDEREILCFTIDLAPPARQSVGPFRSILEDMGILRAKSQVKQDPDKVHFWIASTQGKQAKRVGMALGWGNTGQDSPSRRYFRIQTPCDDHLLFDLTKKEMRRLDPYEGWQGGWWSETELILKTKGQDLEILDAEKGDTRVLATYGELGAFLKERGLGLTNPSWYYLLQAWNGKGYDFYLADNLGGAGGKGSWLIKIDKQTESLLLLKSSFPLARIGHINKDGSLYVYCGERETGDSNAVYVRNIATLKASTLVDGDPKEAYFSLPNFYGDKIIYVQKGAIWIMDKNGENKEQLFPPPNEPRQ